MRKIFTIISLSFLFCFYILGQDIGTAIKNDAASLWTMAPDTFKTSFGSPEIYKWESALKNVLIYRSKGADTKLLFFEQEISKADFKFKSKQLQAISLTLAKSDDLSDKKTYLEHVANLKEQIAKLSKIGSSKERKRKTRGAYRCTYSWRPPEYYISLKSSYTNNSKKTFKAGTIKFSIFRRVAFSAPDKEDEISQETSTGASYEDAIKAINSKISTTDKGDRYLSVPMLIDGTPEECIVSSVKRIYLYNKKKMPAKFWAEVKKKLRLKAKSSKALQRIFNDISREVDCRTKRLITVRDFDDFNAIISFVRRYNKQAKKDKKSKIDPFKINSLNKLVRVMDEEILLKIRNNAKNIANFKDKVCKEIDAEKPVIWVVFIGIIKENPKTLISAGGHVRLIIGYNSKTNEVIYSDSWGKGHERKKMSWEKAWAMTLSAVELTIKK